MCLYVVCLYMTKYWHVHIIETYILYLMASYRIVMSVTSCRVPYIPHVTKLTNLFPYNQ